MADRHTVMKQCMKEIADGSACRITFMAKPTPSEAGSSCHVHVSLWEGDTRASPARSTSARCRLGRVPLVPGRLDGAVAERHAVLRPHHQLLQAVPGRVVGADPDRLVSTTTAPPGSGRRARRRLADRVPHPGRRLQPLPRLRRAARLGLDGIEQPDRPPPAFRGRRLRGPGTPASPAHAARRPSTCSPAATFVRDAFGADVQEHYRHFFRTEQQAYDAAVTDWERQRYFEQI